MTYRVRHITTYEYEDPVSVSHHIIRLTPRGSRHQTCGQTTIRITPEPANRNPHVDYFGNATIAFTLLEPHERLVVEAISEIDVKAVEPPDLAKSAPWEAIRDLMLVARADEELDACQFVFDSPRVARRPELADYSRASFPAGRPLLEAMFDLMQRIHRDFLFDNKATEVSTPVETFFENRRGVCQDFSHLQIACLRSLGLPARYVSGYLRTVPAPGQARLVGADASHAWCATWCPEAGWVDFDPTNSCLRSDAHITIAVGRDYGDVSPIHGVLLGGSRHSLSTGVDVMPLA